MLRRESKYTIKEPIIKYSKKSNNTFYNMDNTSIPVKWYAGIAYYNLKKYNSALKYFQDSYEINPYNTSVMNNYATTLEVIGNSNKAKKDLNWKPKMKIQNGVKDLLRNIKSFYQLNLIIDLNVLNG